MGLGGLRKSSDPLSGQLVSMAATNVAQAKPVRQFGPSGICYRRRRLRCPSKAIAVRHPDFDWRTRHFVDLDLVPAIPVASQVMDDTVGQF